MFPYADEVCIELRLKGLVPCFLTAVSGHTCLARSCCRQGSLSVLDVPSSSFENCRPRPFRGVGEDVAHF